MSRKFFGTDGIRGIANSEALTPEFAFQVGRAGAYVLCREKRDKRLRGKFVLGRDTRISGYMLSQALISGVLSAGVDVIDAGIISTPAIAFLAGCLKGDGGVMISASHNPFDDNGIKFFSPQGFKLPDPTEEEIEELIFSDKLNKFRPLGKDIGMYISYSAAENKYLNFVRRSVPLKEIAGSRIVVDCANGATYKLAPKLFKSMKADVIEINVSPDGININGKCGSIYPETVRDEVLKHKADVGMAFDGDGDRVIFVDEAGNICDGDFLLAICAEFLHEEGRLKNNLLITTVMANLGLELFINKIGCSIIKTPVGDRYVLDSMLENNAILGGEQSGHIIFIERTTTGDGLISALQVLNIMKKKSQPLSKLASCMIKYPQVLINVNVREKKDIDTIPMLRERLTRMEEFLGKDGRILIRYSGTEPIARIMIEGYDVSVIKGMANELANIIRKNIG